MERWLKAPVETVEGKLQSRSRGTPQGGVISPLLSNLFMHYAFDNWMELTHPHIKFERYADDIVVHCVSLRQAEYIKDQISQRMQRCHLELHPQKTKIVYCKNSRRVGTYENTSFDFLGYTFQPRRAKEQRTGKIFTGFLPAMSNKAGKSIRKTMREWELGTKKTYLRLDQVIDLIAPQLHGWMNYFGRFYRSKAIHVLGHVNRVLIKWVMKKYKKMRGRKRKANHWLARVSKTHASLKKLWNLQILSPTGR